jgi:hypothetical protein
VKSLDRTDVATLAAAVLLIAGVWLRHRSMPADKPDVSLNVSQLISRVREELGAHARLLAEKQEKPVFQLKTFDLEVQFVVKRSTKATGGLELEAVTAETSAEDTRERSHKVVLRYEPFPPTKFVVGPTDHHGGSPTPTPKNDKEQQR